HARRDSHVERSRLAVVFEGQPRRGATVRLLERQLDLVFHVMALARPGTAAGTPSRLATCPAEERLEEIRERILVAEDPVHLFFAHRPEAAARPAHVDRPPTASTERTS